MMNLIFDLTFGAIFIGMLFLILTIRYKIRKQEKSYLSGLQTISTWAIAIFSSLIIRVILLFTISFFTIQSTFENYYSDLTGKNNPKVIVKTPSVFASIEQPSYIGDAIKIADIQIGDTIFPIASFNKGKGITGDKYFLIERDGKQYWILEKSLMNLFEYTYANQPLSFSISENDQADLAWKNAKQYMKIYQEYHGDDITDKLMNDTILYIEIDQHSSTQYLKIKKIQRSDGFQFSISAPAFRGRERCVVKGVEDRLRNRPNNDQACAYFIQHGTFFKDEE